MQIKPFIALFPKVPLIGSPGIFCDNAKNSFNQYHENGLYDRCLQAGFYIYQIEHGLHRHIGLVGLNDVNDFLHGRVKKHENTLSERELQQKELFLRWRAILKPILVTHTPVPELHTWMESYIQAHIPFMTVRFKKEEAVHRFWHVHHAEDIVYLQSMFASQVTETYIADGHHRASTTALLHQDPDMQHSGLDLGQLFCAWFASDQLDILDYNRVITGIKKMGAARLMAHLSKLFEIEVLEKARRPHHKHEIVMCLGKEWYALKWRNIILEQAPKGYDTLDTALLNDLVLHQLLGVADIRTDTRITYVDGSKGLDGLKKVVRSNKNDSVGFVFFPITFKELAQMADAGENLPPKSTYFEPRLKSGLLVRQLDQSDQEQ